ncbi:hypothetical protein D3C72_782020 [compost metagenome]
MLTNPRRQLTKRQTGVFHHNLRQVDIQLAADKQCARAVFFRLVGKIVRIKALAFQRHKQTACGDFAGVGRDGINRQILTLQLALEHRSSLA